MRNLPSIKVVHSPQVSGSDQDQWDRVKQISVSVITRFKMAAHAASCVAEELNSELQRTLRTDSWTAAPKFHVSLYNAHFKMSQYKTKAKGCNVLTANCRLQTADYRTQNTDCILHTTYCSFQTRSCSLESTDCIGQTYSDLYRLLNDSAEKFLIAVYGITNSAIKSSFL